MDDVIKVEREVCFMFVNNTWIDGWTDDSVGLWVNSLMNRFIN